MSWAIGSAFETPEEAKRSGASLETKVPISLLPYLQLEGLVCVPNRYECAPETALCLVPYRVSAPSRRKEAMGIFQKSRSWLSAIFNTVVEFLFQLGLLGCTEVLLWKARGVFQRNCSKRRSAWNLGDLLMVRCELFVGPSKIRDSATLDTNVFTL